MTNRDEMKIYAKASQNIPAIILLSIFSILALYHTELGRGWHLLRLNTDPRGEEVMTFLALFFAILTGIAVYQYKNPKVLLILDKSGFKCRIQPKGRVEWSDLVTIEAQVWHKDYMVVPVFNQDAEFMKLRTVKRSFKGGTNRKIYGNPIVISEHILEKPVDEVVQIMMEIGNTGNRFYNK